MSLHMHCQVVCPGERPLTQHALEGPVPRVLSHVPRQLVGSRKSPAAVLPCADIWLFARVRPEMRREVGRLVVALATTGVLAGVSRQFPFQAIMCCPSLEVVLDSNQILSHILCTSKEMSVFKGLQVL